MTWINVSQCSSSKSNANQCSSNWISVNQCSSSRTNANICSNRREATQCKIPCKTIINQFKGVRLSRELLTKTSFKCSRHKNKPKLIQMIRLHFISTSLQIPKDTSLSSLRGVKKAALLENNYSNWRLKVTIKLNPKTRICLWHLMEMKMIKCSSSNKCSSNNNTTFKNKCF